MIPLIRWGMPEYILPGSVLSGAEKGCIVFRSFPAANTGFLQKKIRYHCLTRGKAAAKGNGFFPFCAGQSKEK